MTSSYVIVSIKLCLHHVWYETNAFEITDGEVPDFFWFSGNFIVQCFKAKRRIPINRWLKWYKYKLEKVNFSSIYVRCCLPAGKSTNKTVACENIRLSSLFAAGDVSRWGTSATQRQKFHTDDVKSVRNPVRSADWSTQQLHCFSYCLWMTDKRQKATKVKCKREESLTKQSIFVECSLL